MSKAIVAKITELVEIPGADNIQVGIVLGERVIISKSKQVGDIGLFFPTETQLSAEYCKFNNLFRHSEFNQDTTQKGFFEDSRRVRAQPFLKVRSEGYFADLDSVLYISGRQKFSIGDTFDEINGVKICEKYISKATRQAMERKSRQQTKKILFHTPFFHKHVDTAQFKHVAEMIPVGSLLSFHAKIHGTSARTSHTRVNFELPRWKNFINKFVNIFPTHKWDYVVGTRNVIINDPTKVGYHGSEQFRIDIANLLKPHLEKGMTVYGEIAGFANGKPIMPTHDTSATKNKEFQKKYGQAVTYKYGCQEHEYRFHIYRITLSSPEGKQIDFSQSQLESWCKDRDFLHTLEIAPSEIYDGDVKKLAEKVELLTERPDVLGEDYIDPSHPSEGIIIRIDTGKLTPMFLKSKSYFFKTMEGICEAEDTEDAS